MAKNGSIAQELKALGLELAAAVKEISQSKEFKGLEKEITASAKKISAGIYQTVQAAKKSRSAGKVKRRVGRVAKISAEKGGEKAAQARRIAEAKLKKFGKSLKNMASKMEK